MSLVSRKYYNLVWKESPGVILQRDQEISNVHSILDKCAYHSNQLQVFVVWGNSGSKGFVNDETFRSISKFPSLKTLIIGKTEVCSAITDVGFLRISTLVNLTNLELDYCGVSASCFQIFKNLSQITNLRIRGFDASIDGFKTQDIIAPLVHLPLRRLGLWSGKGRIYDSEFKHLANMTELEELILANCSRDNHTSFSHFTKLTRLGHLGIFHDDIMDQDFVHITKLDKLRSLHLGGCWGLTDTALTKVDRMQKLTHFAITRAPLITGVSLDAICSLPLKCLHLSNCERINAETIGYINRVTSLTRLDLESTNSITDDALRVVSGHPSLRDIRLAILSNIGDAGLKSLTSLRELNTVTIKKCPNVTRPGIDSLIASHKNRYPNDLLIHFTLPNPPTTVGNEDHVEDIY